MCNVPLSRIAYSPEAGSCYIGAIETGCDAHAMEPSKSQLWSLQKLSTWNGQKLQWMSEDRIPRHQWNNKSVTISVHTVIPVKQCSFINTIEWKEVFYAYCYTSIMLIMLITQSLSYRKYGNRKKSSCLHQKVPGELCGARQVLRVPPLRRQFGRERWCGLRQCGLWTEGPEIHPVGSCSR